MMKSSLIIVVITMMMTVGCTGNQALLLDDADVAQVASLRESRAAKVCMKIDGMLDLSSMLVGAKGLASVDGLIVTGKNVTFQQCQEYFQGGPAPSAFTVDENGVVSVEVPE